MSAFDRARWRKSSHSGGEQSECVELTALESGRIGVRDSKDPDGGVLELSRADLAALLRRAL